MGDTSWQHAAMCGRNEFVSRGWLQPSHWWLSESPDDDDFVAY